MDIREQYKGTYQVRISRGYSSYGAIRDTAYICSIKIDYTKEDSIGYAYDAAIQKMLMKPAISLYYVSSGQLYKKLGVDAEGKKYSQKGGWYTVSDGGFINKDSIYSYYGETGPHTTIIDTLVCYRIK